MNDATEHIRWIPVPCPQCAPPPGANRQQRREAKRRQVKCKMCFGSGQVTKSVPA